MPTEIKIPAEIEVVNVLLYIYTHSISIPIDLGVVVEDYKKKAECIL